MTHPCLQTVAKAVAALRSATLPAKAGTDAPLVENVYFSWDASKAKVEIALDRAPGSLQRWRQTVGGTPGWLNLNLALGPGVFEPGQVLGLIVATRPVGDNPEPIVIEGFVRSSRAGKTFDTHLAQPLTLTSDDGPATMLHPIARLDPICEPKGFHTLILRLPKRDLTLDLTDLRLFLVRPDGPERPRRLDALAVAPT